MQQATFPEGVNKPADFTFTWPWGEQGSCAGEDRILVTQKAESLGRGAVAFTPIDPSKLEAVTVDERTQFHARILALTTEVENVKARGAELYHINTELSAEARRLRARNTEVEAQLSDRVADIELLQKERDTARADAFEAQEEVQRLKLLIPSEGPPTEQ